MQEKVKSYKISHIILIMFWIIITGSNVPAELKLESVEPRIGLLGKNLEVTLTGTGFDENTKVAMYIDAGNRMNIRGSLNIPGFVTGLAVSDNIVYVTNGSKGLQIIKANNPLNPVKIANVDIRTAEGVAVNGDTAYVACSTGFYILDVSDPSNPVEIGSLGALSPEGVTVIGSKAYAVDGSSLQIVDVNTPSNPVVLGSVDTPTGAGGVTVVGNKAYVATNSGLQIIDVSNSSYPEIIGSVSTPSRAREVTVVKDTAYVADRYGGLQIIDVSKPSDLHVISSVDIASGLTDGVTVIENMAYIAHGSAGLEVIDVNDPSDPKVVGYVETSGIANRVAVSGNTAYVTALDGQNSILYVVDIENPPDSNVIGARSDYGYVFDIITKGDIAYVSYLSLDGDAAGLQIINVSNPYKHEVIGFLETGRIWGIAVAENTVYVSVNGDLQVIDVSNSSNPVLLGTVSTPGSANGIEVVGNTAYIADGAAGLQIVDVSNLSAPHITGSVTTPGNAESITVVENTAYVTVDDTGFQIIDISNSSHPEKISFVNTPGCAREVIVIENKAYVADCYAGLQITDVSNPSQPVNITNVETQGNARGVAVIGNTAYVAADDGGLQMIDVSNPSNPTVIGFVDTAGFAEKVTVNEITNIAYVADFSKGLQTIVPLPIEITPDTVNNETNISVTLLDPQINGNYTLKVFNQTQSDKSDGAVTFISPENSYILDTKVIILAGGDPDSGTNNIWDETKDAADHAYEALRYQGYTPDSIFYLSPVKNSDKIDRVATYENLDYAINTWAKEENPNPASKLLLFFVDHGTVGGFKINSYQELRAEDLNSWLDKLQEELQIGVIFIYDACNSGSFLSRMNGENRMVITSTLEEEPAYFLGKGKTSFSYQFWDSIYNGDELYKAFSWGSRQMESYQTALIDANANGTGNEPEDEKLSDNIVMGRGYKPETNRPLIYSTPQVGPLNGETSATLWASVGHPDGDISQVWAEIAPPAFNPGLSFSVTKLPTVEFQKTDSEDTYQGVYEDFTIKGDYTITIYAVTEDKHYALPSKITVTQTEGNPYAGFYIIESISDLILYDNKTSATIWTNVSCPIELSRVWAEIFLPNSDTPFTEMDLQYSDNDGIYKGVYGDFDKKGNYKIVIHAMDINGISISAETLITHKDSGAKADSYEEDDTIGQAGFIRLDEIQSHNFHCAGDTDWGSYYGMPGETYTIEVSNVYKTCDVVIDIYEYNANDPELLKSKNDGSAGEDEYLDYSQKEKGFFFVKLSNFDPNIFGEHVTYNIKLTNNQGAEVGKLVGIITDISGNPVAEAMISTSGGGADLSREDGSYIVKDPPGNYTLTVEAVGYNTVEIPVILKQDETITLNIVMTPIADINEDGNLDLEDAVYVLQLIAGDKIFSSDSLQKADVNGDERIGLEELVYILQKISRLR